MDQSNQYSDLINTSQNNTDIANITSNLTLSYINPFAILETDLGSNVIGVNLTNGQLLIGSIGVAPIASTLTGTLNQVNVTNGAGIITLSTPQSINTTSAVTFGSIIDSELTATTLTASNASKQLQSVIIANSNGSNGSFAASTLTLSNSQDLSTLGTPTFANIIDSGLTATTLIATNGSKQLQSVTIANTNGSNGSFSLSTLTLSNSQDLSTLGAPTFANIIDSGLTATLLVGTNASKQLQSLTTTSSNGVTALVVGSQLGIDTPQDIRPTAVVTFADITDSSLTVTKLVASDALKKLQSVTLAVASNGASLSFSGSTLTATNQQDISSTATPTFANIIDSGLTATTLTASNASKQLQSVTIANSNGSNGSFAGSTLALSNSQDLSTLGTPTFSNIIDSGLTATTLIATNGSKQLQSVTLAAASNGASLSFSGSTLTATNSQDISTSATPTFANIIDTGLASSGGNLVYALASGQLGTAPLGDGQLIIGNGIGIFGQANLGAGTNIAITNGHGTISIATVASPSFTNVTATGQINVDTIVGNTTDLRINPLTTSGSIYLSHDNTTANVFVGAGSTNVLFNVRHTGSTNDFNVSNKVVTTANNTLDNGTGGLTAILSVTTPNLIGAKLGEYGDGSDGAVTISVNTNLARDMYYSTLTVNTGIVLNAAGFRVFVQGLLTLTGTGVISNDGTVGGTASSNVNGAGGAGASSGTIGGGTSGGAGGISAGVAAVNGTNISNACGNTGGAGGGIGASGGTVGNPATNSGGTQVIKALPYSLNGRDLTNTLINGASGGGGGKGTGGLAGGGGGGGGGVVIVAANTVTGSGTIRAKGGDGGQNTSVWYAGGGGGGGCVILLTSTVSPSVTLSAAGGLSGGAFPGTAGTAGVTLTLTH